MTDPLDDTHTLSADELAELTGEGEGQDETGAPENGPETGDTVPSESSGALGGGVPQPFVPEDAPSPPASRRWST